MTTECTVGFSLSGRWGEGDDNFSWFVNRICLLKRKIIYSVFQLTGLHVNYNTSTVGGGGRGRGMTILVGLSIVFAY